MPYEHTPAVYEVAEPGVGVLERHEVVLAGLHVEILAGKSAEPAEVVGDGVLAENVVVEDDAEVAGEAGDASELEVGLLFDDAMAVGQNFGLRGERREGPATSSQFSATNSQSMATRSPAPGSSAGARRR